MGKVTRQKIFSQLVHLPLLSSTVTKTPTKPHHPEGKKAGGIPKLPYHDADYIIINYDNRVGEN